MFRNESLDATHLAEFHQIEGVMADYNLTLGDLIGVLHEFFKKLGKKVKENTFWIDHYRNYIERTLYLTSCMYKFVFSGITKLRFKPAYNPYTEPSMEVFSYHDGRWLFTC